MIISYSPFVCHHGACTRCGKSTLGLVLARALDFQGRVLLDERLDAVSITLRDYRERVLVFTQDAYVLGGSVRSFLGCNGAPSDERAARVLRRLAVACGGNDAASHLTLDTHLTANAANLSAGERAVVALTRVCLVPVDSVRAVVLDELLAALEPSAALAALRCVRDELCAHRVTVVVVTHRPALMHECDEVIVLDGGRVVDAGASAAVLQRHDL